MRNVLDVGEIRRSLHLRTRCTVVYLPDPQHSLTHGVVQRHSAQRHVPHRTDSIRSTSHALLSILPTNLGTSRGWIRRFLACAKTAPIRSRPRTPCGPMPGSTVPLRPLCHSGLCATARHTGLSQPDLLVGMSRAVLQRAASAHRIRSNSCVAAAANDAALQHQGRHAE